MDLARLMQPQPVSPSDFYSRGSLAILGGESSTAPVYTGACFGRALKIWRMALMDLLLFGDARPSVVKSRQNTLVLGM